MSEEQDNIQKAAQAIDQASALLITAGAGIGVDSGLPDFRGNQGFWKAYPALKGYPFEEMANPQWFDSDPTRAWGFYGHRLNLYRKTIPHKGFDILHAWAQKIPTFVFTSNVDGQFQKAGFSEEQIMECHGSIHWLQHCHPDEYGKEIWSAESTLIDVDEKEVRAREPLPTKKGVLLRPNILMFGDSYWLGERCDTQREQLNNWLQTVDTSRIVVVEMGAGTSIPTVRNFSSRIQRAGGTLIRINPRESHGATYPLAMGAKDGLEAIKEHL